MRKRSFSKFRRRAPARHSRMDTMWAPYVGSGDDDPYSAFSGTGGNPERVISISAASFKTAASGLLLSTGQSAKLLRFDGFVYLYCDPSESGFTYSEPDHTRLMYWWVKEKLDADAYSGNEMASTTSKMDPVSDWANIMRRRDVMKWGMLDVYAPIPEVVSTIPVVTGISSTVSANFTNHDGTLFVNKRMSFHPVGAKLPFPKVPKGGFNLMAGEVINCYTQGFSLSDTLGSNARPVLAFPRFRMLLSV